MKRLSWLWLLALAGVCARLSGAVDVSEEATNLPALADPADKEFHTEPAGDDPAIASFTAKVLSQSHYRKQRLNEQMSEKFFDQFLDTLDPAHMILLQADVQEFERFRKELDKRTLMGDTTPAHLIFARYIERIDQQAAFVKDLLRTNTFVFTGNELYELDRKKLPRPQSLDEAKKLWLERLRFEYLQEKLNKEKPEEIVKKITRRYKNVQRILKEFDSGDVLQYYLDSLAHVYDPHSDYMGRARAENFKISMNLSLFGIGAQLQSEDGYCRIKELVAGGPAEKSKRLRQNDRIIAVAQGDQEPVDIVDMKLDKAVGLIRGPKGTEVRLTIIPANATDPSVRRVVTLIRDEIKLEEQAAKAKIVDLPGTNGMRLGLIDLPSFYHEFPTAEKSTDLKSSTADVKRLLRKLKKEKVDGVVLDLRQNGGGSLEEAVRLTGLFIRSGPVVLVRDSNGDISVDADTDASIQYEGPLAVLTSRFSASASEILAGALQDYDRAVIVGDKSTHGKGTVQQLMQLEPYMRQMGYKLTNDPGQLKFTIRKFYRATGASTQLKGVVPDLILPSVNNYAEVGEENIPGALPYDTIGSAKYESMNLVSRYVPELKKRSDVRVAADPDFSYLAGVIERFKKSKEDKAISMNEEQRWREKKEETARQEERKKDLKARPDSGEKVYEITLKLVDKDGLPEPMAKTNLAASAKTPAGVNPHAPGSSDVMTGFVVTGATPAVDRVEVKELTITNADSSVTTRWVTNALESTTAPVAKVVDTKKKDPEDPDADLEDDVTEVDIAMNEAKRVLCDLVQLTKDKPAANGLAVTSPAK